MYFSHHACIRFYVRSCHDEHHRYKRTAQVPPWYSLAFQISDLRRYVIMQQSSRPLKRQSSVSVLLNTATTTSPPTRHSWGKAVMETSIDRIHCNKKAKSNWFGNLGVMAWIFRIKTHGLIIEGLLSGPGRQLESDCVSTLTEIHASVCISKFNLEKFASLKGLKDKLYYRILLSVNLIIGLLYRPSTKTSKNKKVLAACILLTASTKMISIFVLFFTPFLQLSLPNDPSTHKHKRSLRWQRLGRWCARGWCGCAWYSSRMASAWSQDGP